MEKCDYVAGLLRAGFFDVICRKRPGAAIDHIELEFPYMAKSALDELRQVVVPTVVNHHRLRIIASEYVDLIEKKELTNHPERREAVSRNLENRLIWDELEKGKVIGIEHVKLDGRVIYLSEGELLAVNPGKKELVLKRSRFKGRSQYDGLNLPKQAGDYAITRIREGDWHYVHTYMRASGEPIGKYYNINTPVEIYPDRVRYVDLEIDMVRWDEGQTKIIDERELDRAYEMGYISDTLRHTAKQEADRLIHNAIRCGGPR